MSGIFATIFGCVSIITAAAAGTLFERDADGEAMKALGVSIVFMILGLLIA